MASSSRRTASIDPHRNSRPHKSYHHNKRRPRDVDIIDQLDHCSIGGAYHHGGPYDAALPSHNLDSQLSPMAALRESNLEALRATPANFIYDSLVKQVPLQGTATIPPGFLDYNGNLMQYKEGADLMRDPDAPGGPYKRYPGIVSRPFPGINPQSFLCPSY